MSLLKHITGSMRLILSYTKANTLAAMEYRSAFIVQIVAMLASDCLWLFFWWSYFQQFPLVNDWQQGDVVILWAVGACSFGVSMAVAGNARRIALLIVNGGLDAYLGMPRNVLLHICIAGTSPAAWGDILFAIGAFLLLLQPAVGQIALFVLLVILGAVIYTSFVILFCSLAFFIGNTDSLAQQMLMALITFSTYPMSIFNGAIRVVLFTVIPAGFITFVPLQLLRNFSWPLLGAMAGAVLIIALLATGLFTLGLRRYESGNLLGMQN